MGTVMRSRSEIVEALVERKVQRDRASMYADCFLEYHDATANILVNGTICSHPRTGAPIVNPYVSIRDGALKKLQGFRGLPAAFLWEESES